MNVPDDVLERAAQLLTDRARTVTHPRMFDVEHYARAAAVEIAGLLLGPNPVLDDVIAYAQEMAFFIEYGGRRCPATKIREDGRTVRCTLAVDDASHRISDGYHWYEDES